MYLQIPPPEPVNFRGNIEENWRYFKSHWRNFSIATGLDNKEDKLKVATLLSIIGKEAYNIFEHLDLSDEQRNNSDEIINALTQHFTPKINIIYERSILNQTNQETNESIEQYICRLRKLSSTCNYGAMTEEMIRDRLVLGIIDKQTKRQLISDPQLTLQKAIDVCKANESANKQIENLTKNTQEEVNKLNIRKKTVNQNKIKKNIPCRYCATFHEHNRQKCPAWNQTCRKCNKKNHWAKVCKSRMRTVQSLESQNSNDEQEDCYSLEYVSEISARKLMTKLELELNGYKESIICQIDTGANVNVLNFADLCKIMQDGNPSLKPSYIKLRCYGGEILKPRGQIKINCFHQSKQHPIVFQVIDHWEKPILSAETCQKLNLIEIKADLCKIESTWTKQNNLLDKYKDIFEGIGCLQGEYKLETDPTIKPIKQAPRRVPITLRKELKEKLIDMEKKNIIAKVDYPTDWISNLVLVKSTKKLRICIDPRELNVALKRAEYPIPTIEEIIPNLQNAKIFTVVDTKDGFWNVKLSDESSNLTTFWTPFGRYKFLRMPFGLKTASEEYQRRLYEIFQGLEGIEIIADDILILGKGDSYEEALKDHDRNLENLFKTARQANLKFNINKVKLRLKEVKYLGHIITPHGLKPDPEKVKALKEMPHPESITELKSFLGFATYLCKFMPNISMISEPLRKLTMKNSTWSWSKNHQAAFEKIKDLASKAPILRYFDADKSIAIQCDASKHGLGATLLQESQPIIFASRSLSKTEQNYAQIEKECLAIVFACERFHQYILGKCQVIVQTDHKPLLSIFKKSILKAPQRLQRMLLRLQRYNLELEHVQGSQMHLADIFSRACIKDVRNENLKYDVYPIDIIYKEIATVNVMETLSVCSDTVLRIREETSSDPILCEVKKLILNGWPPNKNQTSMLTREYWNFREELTVQDGIILKNDRIVFPNKLRAEMIMKTHQGHIGINSKLPNNSGSLLRIFEVECLENTTSEYIIECCKRQFSRYGIPQIIVSDNGRQFTSTEFQKFSKEWQFQHSTSSPLHSQGNGKAEAAVKIAKNLLKKSKQENSDFWQNLLNWRNTPTIDIDSSPVQRIMSRRTRAILPIHPNLLKPSIPENIPDKISIKRQQAKYYYDRKSKNLPDLDIGQEVYVRTPNTTPSWSKANITNEHNTRSYDVNIHGRTYRRNRTWIKPQQASANQKSTNNQEEGRKESIDQEQTVSNCLPSTSSAGGDNIVKRTRIETTKCRIQSKSDSPTYFNLDGKLRRSRRLQSLPPLLVEMVNEEEKPHVQPAAFTYLQQPRNPPNFSGKGSELAHLWLKDYSRVAAYNGWDESMCLANVVFFLEGAARCWFDNVEESITTWNTFEEEFTRTFGDKEDYARRIESSLKVRAQKPDESVELYIQDVLNLCRQLNPNMSEEDRVGHLMKGVAENIYRALLAIEVTTTGEFTQHCRRIEKLNKNRISSVRFERIPTVSAINENEYHPLKEMIREIIREELRSAPNELDNLPPPQGLEDRVWQRVEQNLAPIDKAPVFHSGRAVKNFRSGQQNAGEANYDPTGLPLLLVIPRHLRMEILGDLHDAPTAGHLGFAKTYDRIRRRFFWPGMYRSVRKYVGHCQDCQRRKSVPQLPPGYLRPIPPPDRPFQKVGIDLLGRFPISQGKKKWIVVCTDYLTKYAVTQSLGSGEAQEIAKFLLEEVILKHGAPREIVMDRGRNFQSRLIQELTKNCHIKKKTTTAYHPQTNGLTERLNRTIADMLSMYMDLDQKNWDEMLPFITFAYNTARQESTGFTPFFLVHGREAETTLDTIFPYSSASEGEEFIQLVASRAEEARQIARHHIFKAQETNKLNYDARHKGKVYQPGDLVWIFTPIRRVGLSEKLLRSKKPPVLETGSVLRRCKKTSTYVSPRDAAERDLGCTETFDFSTPNEWPKWRKRFERYLVVSGMKKKEEADKIDLFMYLMGDRADDIFRTFKFEKEEEATKIDSVLKAFDGHFCVRKNIIYERAKFNSRIQEDREPVDEFITSLYKLADSCEFEGLHEQLIRDRIVVGVRDKALSERMQLDSELTLEKAVKLVRQQEAVRQQQVDLQRPSTSQKVDQVKFNSKKQSPKQQQQPSRKKDKSAKTRLRCPKCGGFTHREGQACRAEGQRCNLCSKTGHFANCCPDKQEKTAEVKAVSELDEEIGFLLEVSAVEDSSNLDNDEDECRRRWTAEIQVNGKQVKFKLDSQADVTCVPLCLFKKMMGQQRLVESDINIRAAEFSELQTAGMFISTLRNGNYEIKEKIYVIRRLSEPLLSRRACELLNLARRIEVVATRINPIKEFPEVFEGLGQIGNPYEIKLKPGAKPYAVHTPRRVPIPLMEKLKTRLEELEKAGIIAQVNVATEWCAPTVIAGKPNGDIRLCVDLSRLNEHVQREVHPMPVVEHMLGQLGEARFFSKLDANSGFHQIPLSPDCQHLTTFITPFGRYKYCRMPFGISLAPEYFQKVMSIILQGMDGVMCYLDDILIFASDSKTHDRILRLVLRKLKEAKVTLNKAKCVFGVPRINFLGHILDEDGIRPDPAKIEAVAKMPAPTDVHGVRRFLGMVNHLGRFVENLSEIVAPLNQLLVKGQDFVWDCSQERAFRKLKELLTTQPILAAYDVRKPTMVSSDASSYGLGAVLKQEGKNGIWRPVAYSSRTMTPTEKRYAQIEKEAFAITWACERFQDFLLGKRFRIETDHKPLIPLFSTKELSSLTPRLQRFRMRMMRFGFEIVHIPGKELLDADALSRQPLLTTEGGENERQTSAHINAVLSSITDKDEMLTKIFEAQQEDTTLKAVVNYFEQGWPDKKKMSQALLSYWHVKDELGVQNGLLMRSCRLVIPASMKLEILDKLHTGHFGITKTRLRARETVWWPGISEEIAETVKKCSVCIQEAVSKHEPLIPTNFPTRPWQNIGMDLFKFENKWYLVVIDYYSRYPEMVQLDRLTASVVVRSCKSIFARHGVPETVVSDNGTQFGAAREFANFARQYGFTHVTSSPRFPQSNGMAEAGVKIAKLILKKNQDPSLGLLEYRSTPLENGYSPAELLMGRKLRTTLPIAPENLNPKLVDSQALKRKEGRRRKDMKSRYDRRCGATDMEELSEGDTVWITDMRTWGIVKKKASTPRMVETRSGKMQDPAQERIQAEESAKPQPGATIGRDASSDPVVLNPNIDIPKYDGTEDPRPWIESLEEIGFLYHWADYIISRYAAMNMTGSAKTWLNLHKASFTSWENIKIRLIQDFSLDANKEELRMKLNRMQHWNEPAIRFAEDILVLCNKVDPAMEEETKIEHVIGGLKKEYSFALYLNPPKTTDDLLVVCKKMDYFEKKYRERVEKSRNLYNGPRYSRPQQQSRYVPPTAARNYQTTSRPQAPVSNNYKNDSPPTPRQYRNNFPQPSTPRRPYNPNFVPKPNLQRNTYNKSQEVSKNRTEDGRPICFKCNKPGHVARYCRVKFIRILEEDPADTQEKVEEKCQMNETSKKSGPRLYADIGTFEALVDTGADLSVVDLRTALDTGHGISKLAKICAGPDGKKLDMVGSIFLNIKIDDETLSHNFVILKTHLRTLILGRDFLKKMNAKIDCNQETIKYDWTNNHDEINFEMLKIKSAKDSIVPECSMKLIKALVETEDGEYIIEESSKMFQTNGLRLARSLINVINRETHIWITNPYPRPLKIMKNQTLAFGSSPAKINVSREREVEKNEEPRFQINENLSPKEQKELKQVLERYGDLFSSKLGRTNLAKHRIDTEDAKPIKHKPYRVSAKERDIIKEQIDEMLTEGIIRPSSSPWSFPVILVKKRDGKYRFCVDYRKLNNVTVKDVYPIPRIDEVMDTLQGSTHFSAIDLRSGYWQVEVEERDKEKTAFTTAHGLYEFNVMPFGLCNAPATFERNMENMLGNLRWQICLCYLDDVIIYSPDFPTHLKRLEAVFRRFRESNLRLNDKKCRFAFEELEILGYITSKHGIKPAEHNIKAVRNFPRPKKVKEVQSFLGMCSYYRKFIKDFSKIADPLTNLIKKSVSFTWTERQEEAFQTLKTALLSPPILGHFNPNAPTYVHTDASNIGIGATLVQDIGGEEKVISYLSRTLSKAEQNYSTTEKECLAVVWSMSKLRPYLYGRHFKIVTDHHALCWLKNLKDPTGRLARWALKIQEYDFDIIHKSGKKHLDADGLSRGPLPETDWDEDFERLFLNQITDEEDKFIESVKKNFNGSRRSIAQNFKEEDGCLFKKNPNPEGRAWLLVVPENKKREIMKEYHNHMSNGHLGVARTMYRIKSKYFWPSMLKDVSEFVKTCHLCQSRKGSNQLPSGLLQPIPPANFPFERIGIDFVGPLPSTKNRKKWIIVLSDYYTRYAETRAVSEATVKEVSKFLVEDIFLRHGAPQYLISDRGSQFTSNLMKEVMKTCKIKHCFTTSYHPQTNGLTERLNRTLINMLSMYVNTDQKNWDEILPFITHAYNTTIQETTGYSPFFLMFGREPTSLLDDRNISVDIDKDDYDEYIKHHLDKINRTRKLVINNTIKTQERMKKNYDKKHMERSYEPGELVAVWTPIRKIGKCEKLLRKYFGPYRILKKLSNVNYLIEPKDNPGQDPLIVHVSRIKPYFERIDEVNHEDKEGSNETSTPRGKDEVRGLTTRMAYSSRPKKKVEG
ncbi:K02A2.6-like [Cordylochernes scorpioides]|uniref:RNA-directed DNA polymerase n=1 Tax=Cordylochernes scorpioides TaxID=51811 RepID=A0ABY6L207_9ARAC|nr:K02A2.6-like [Cordylochernes scorpioides]